MRIEEVLMKILRTDDESRIFPQIWYLMWLVMLLTWIIVEVYK